MSHHTSWWFQHLKTLAQKQGFLTYANVNLTLPIEIVDPVEIERIVELLKDAGIKIVPDSSAASI
jgi:hypothetical protein